MADTLLEMAVHMGMELYPSDEQSRESYIDWYIETEGGKRLSAAEQSMEDMGFCIVEA